MNRANAVSRDAPARAVQYFLIAFQIAEATDVDMSCPSYKANVTSSLTEVVIFAKQDGLLYRTSPAAFSQHLNQSWLVASSHLQLLTRDQAQFSKRLPSFWTTRCNYFPWG